VNWDVLKGAKVKKSDNRELEDSDRKY